MSPRGFVLLITALIFLQVMQTIAQRKKYRCVSDRDQLRCSVMKTTPQPERRQILLIRPQNKPKSPTGTRPVIIVKKPSQSLGQKSQSSASQFTGKSLPDPYAKLNLSNSMMKFSPDSFNFLTIPLKFLATLLSPFTAQAAKAKYNTSSLPLVNFQVPMTLSLVHSAAAPAVAYGSNNLPVYCQTQCAYTGSSSIPCNQPCSNINTLPIPCIPPSEGTSSASPVPCAVPQPLPPPSDPQPNNCTANNPRVPCNPAQPDNPEKTATVPCVPKPGADVTSTSPAPHDPNEDVINTVPTAPCSSNNTALYVLICRVLKEVHNLTALGCPKICSNQPTKEVMTVPTPSPDKSTTPAIEIVTEITTLQPTPSTTSSTPRDCETLTTESTATTTYTPPCTPPESILACLFALPKKICKPCTASRPSIAKPKPISLCKLHHMTSCDHSAMHSHHHP